ncbi:MAG: chemotaxis protein CheW [Cyanobacteria bacterium P01_H01_bin.15]
MTVEVKGQLLKVMSFRVGDLHIALSLQSIQRIVNHQVVDALSYDGMHEVDGKTVPALNLFELFYKMPLPADALTPTNLILSKTSENQLFGVAISHLPTLLDLTTGQLRPLPEDWQQSPVFQSLAYFAQLPQEDAQPLTVCVLDCDRLYAQMVR